MVTNDEELEAVVEAVVVVDSNVDVVLWHPTSLL